MPPPGWVCRRYFFIGREHLYEARPKGEESKPGVIARYPRFPLPPFNEEWRPRKFLHAEMPRSSSARDHTLVYARETLKREWLKIELLEPDRLSTIARSMFFFFPSTPPFL